VAVESKYDAYPFAGSYSGARGRDAVFPGKPGPPPDAERRRRVTEALRKLLQQERTWTSRQLGAALHERGIALGSRQVRRYLGQLDAGYRRTSTTLKHKQEPAKVERAKRVLDNLKKKVVEGRLTLYYLDECGFSPTSPAGYSWCLPGQRKRVKHESPQGRRVNARAALRPYGRSPRVVVRDNGSLHISKVVRRSRRELARRGIYLVLPPPYSPELNQIEPVFGQVKYHEIPVRSHTALAGLRLAVEAGFGSYRGRLLRKSS
jgi:hypothetical protein